MINLTHVLPDTSLVQCSKTMPQHALEMPFIFSLPISRAPSPLLWLPSLPAAFVVCSVYECEPALPLHGVSLPLAFIPFLVAEGVLSPSCTLIPTPLASIDSTIFVGTCTLPASSGHADTNILHHWIDLTLAFHSGLWLHQAGNSGCAKQRVSNKLVSKHAAK